MIVHVPQGPININFKIKILSSTTQIKVGAVTPGNDTWKYQSWKMHTSRHRSVFKYDGYEVEDSRRIALNKQKP